MPISDSFKKHGVSHVVCDSLAVIEAARAVMGVLGRARQPRVVALAVAGVLVRMQAELAGDTIDNTIELMRMYIDSLQRDLKIPKA